MNRYSKLPYGEVRSIISDISQYDDKRVVNVLINALNEKEPIFQQYYRAYKKENFYNFIKEPIDIWAYLDIYDSAWKVRASSAFFLGELKDIKAVESLIYVMLNDENIRVRGNCAGALGELRDKKSVNPLISLLSHPNENLRSASAFALGKIKDKRAVNPLIALLNDPIFLVKRYSIISLGYIGDKQALKSLISLMNNERNNELCCYVAIALAFLKDKRGLKKLLTLYPTIKKENTQNSIKYHLNELSQKTKDYEIKKITNELLNFY